MPDKNNGLNQLPILKTKLFVSPLRSNYVPRPRLTGKMDQTGCCKLTLISAPAGYGKTTVLCDWVHQNNRPAAWYSIDQTDNNPIQFYSYIIAALQKTGLKIGQSLLPALNMSQQIPPEIAAAAIINDAASSSKDITLIFEDYHMIEEMQIHKMTAFLLEHMPQNMHLVIAARSDPPLPLARMRSRNQMLELRAADLCFNKEEISIFFKKVINLELPNEDIAVLESRTEGWIAGLQLAALSIFKRKDISEFIKNFAGDDRHIMDYLVEEVLSRQPEIIRTFLLKTSILERLSASLCNVVTGFENSQEILSDLEKANLFIVALDDKRKWFRYHHLFADLLRVRLGEVYGDVVPELHRRAGRWYEREGLITQAISHSMAAKDYEQAAELTLQSCKDRMKHGEDFTVMFLRIAALPEEILQANPYLNVMYAWMLSITLRIDQAESRLSAIEKQAAGQLPADLLLQIETIRSELARHTKKFSRAVKHSEKVLASLPKEHSITDKQTHTGAVFNLAWTFLDMGEAAKAEYWFSESLKTAQAAGSITLILLALRGLGLVSVLQGRLNQAAEFCNQGLRLADKAAEKFGQAVPAAAYIHTCLGDLLRQKNKLQEAEYHLKTGIELCEKSQMDAETLRESYLSLACLNIVQKDFNGANEVFQKTERLAMEFQYLPEFNRPIEACQAHLEIAAADLNGETSPLMRAEQRIKKRGLKIDGAVESAVNEMEYFVWARLLIIKNEPAQALKLLTNLKKQADAAGRSGRIIEIFILQAVALYGQGNINQSLPVLEHAVTLAQPEGFIRIFLDEGKSAAVLLELLQQKLKQSKMDNSNKLILDYVKTLLLEYKTGLSLRTDNNTADTLSERELEVLRFIAAGLGNKAIAQKLFISLDTVKSHTKNINSKLNVHSRTEAVVRAKELEIL